MELFRDDPEDFFNTYGYFFVIGYTTGSTFNGLFEYESNNSFVLKEISDNLASISSN